MPDRTSDAPAAGREPPPPLAGARATAKSVLVSNFVAGAVIRTGGFLVIVAVVGILAFLVGTVIPLFRSASVAERPGAGRVPVEGAVRMLVMDEYRMLAVAVGDAPEVVCFRTDDGQVVSRFPIDGLGGETVTVARRGIRRPETVVGTASGRFALLQVGFRSDYILGDAAEDLRSAMRVGEVRATDGGAVQRRPGGTLLRVRPTVELAGSARLPAPAGAVVAASFAAVEEKRVVAAAGADGRAYLFRDAAVVAAPGAGPPTLAPLELAPGEPSAPPGLVHALVDEEVRTAWFADAAGVLLRVDLVPATPVRREVRALLPAGTSGGLSALEFVLGDRSLAVGDGAGGLAIWSLVNAGVGTGSSDGKVLRRLHAFDRFDSPIVRIVSAPTRRSLYLGHADGRVTATYTVNSRVVASVEAFRGPVAAIAAGWKDDGVFVAGPGLGTKAFDLDNPHPETNARALFAEVHYEGYDVPSFQYQSSSGTDESEPKLSLTPLVFGTLKAVFYAMLFALPLALLAALYTSQFMHPKVRAFVKPGIEVMASLPSVVLGFLAALVIAPAIAEVVPAVFATLLGIAVAGFAAGVGWQGLPVEIRAGTSSATKLLLATGLVAAVAFVAVATVGGVQAALFAGPANPSGDFRIWLSGAPETGDGLPLLRVTLGVVGAALGFFLVPRFLPLAGLDGAGRVGARVIVWVLAPALVFAFLLAPLVEHAVFRDSFRWFLVGKSDGVGTVFDVRNSLVVGIAMGFAVIPVIYTIAEDALSSIPDSLRSAALGCGASPWQAATRVVLPAAIPGIFSAVMIGLGRAVGETMIVLMATGGTAIIDGSLFNGFRTLSANIATELPEAPAGGTLYRVLFLAGLLLFVLTFVLNTIAEAVRLRFRRKFRGL